MPPLFEELDWRPTEIGTLSLRRRWDPKLAAEIYEIKLGEAFLMTSRFTASELALARLGLEAAAGRADAEAGLDVVVGGLGLGYTAAAALERPDVASLLIVELLEPVIDWHRTGLLPLGPRLTGDARCRLVQGDFFAAATGEGPGFDPDAPDRRFHAVLLDIDHAPDDRLDARSADFYRPESLVCLRRHLHPGGIFGLWSNEPPDPDVVERLSEAFAEACVEPVVFDNPLQDRAVTQAVYLARA
jgi:spermidine synthase